MQIKYNPIRTITTADLFIACDPPITFDVKARLSPAWAIKSREWEESDSPDIDTAIELMSESFVSVAQDNETFPLTSIKAVQSLRDSIEQDNEGYGDEFIIHLVEMFSNNHFRFLALASAKSAKLLRPSNGMVKEKSKVKSS